MSYESSSLPVHESGEVWAMALSKKSNAASWMTEASVEFSSGTTMSRRSHPDRRVTAQFVASSDIFRVLSWNPASDN